MSELLRIENKKEFESLDSSSGGSIGIFGKNDTVLEASQLIKKLTYPVKIADQFLQPSTSDNSTT